MKGAPVPITYSFEGGLLPADLAPSAAGLDQRAAQAVGILVKVHQRAALGAEVAPGKRIEDVAADRPFFAAC